MQDACWPRRPRSTACRPNEQIVFGVTLFYYNWEDTSGLPAQIVMQAERQKLLDAQLGRASRAVSRFRRFKVQEL